MNLFSIFLAVSIPNNSDNRHRKENRRVTIYRVRWNAFHCKGQEQNEIRDIFDRIYVILSMMRNIWNLPEPVFRNPKHASGIHIILSILTI